MKIAIITDSFPPLRNSGAVQIRDLSLEFVKNGHEVWVITPSAEINSGAFLESMGNVQVLRLKTLKIKNISYLRRAVAEFLMPFMMNYHLKKASIDYGSFDGVVTYAPSIFLGPVAKIFSHKSGCKNYLIVRDIFPQWAVDVGLLKPLGLPYLVLKQIELYLYSIANTIGVQTTSNIDYFHNVVDGSTHVEVLQNWLAKGNETSCSITIADTVLDGRKIFVYAGNIGDAQGLSIFIDLADRLQQNRAVGFLFVGRGSSLELL